MTNWNSIDIVMFWALIVAGVVLIVSLFGGRK